MKLYSIKDNKNSGSMMILSSTCFFTGNISHFLMQVNAKLEEKLGYIFNIKKYNQCNYPVI